MNLAPWLIASLPRLCLHSKEMAPVGGASGRNLPGGGQSLVVPRCRCPGIRLGEAGDGSPVLEAGGRSRPHPPAQQKTGRKLEVMLDALAGRLLSHQDAPRSL